jgi:hypothetical protein
VYPDLVDKPAPEPPPAVAPIESGAGVGLRLDVSA